MDREEKRMERDMAPASDEGVPDPGGKTTPDPSDHTTALLAPEGPNRLVFDIARMIGRQLAREDYQRRTPANDNCDAVDGGDGD